MVVMGIAGLYTQVSAERDAELVVKTGASFATEGGTVGIGSDHPLWNLQITETESDGKFYPSLIMDDTDTPEGSGYRFQMRIDTQAGEKQMQYYYPNAGTEPGWGMYMRVDDYQNARLFGDVCTKRLEDPETGVLGPARMGVGVDHETMQTSDPDGEEDGLLDAHDVYVRAADDGSGDWFSNYTRQKMHMVKMVRSSAQVIPYGLGSGGGEVREKIDLDDEEFDIGDMGDAANSRIEIKQSGMYLANASLWIPRFTQAHREKGTSWLSVYIYVNGEESCHSRCYVKGPRNTWGFAMVRDVLDLDEGDYLEMWVCQTASAGGTRSTETGIHFRPRISVIQLGAPSP